MTGHLTHEVRQCEVDTYYGAVLNPPLSEMFKLEQQLAVSRNPRQSKLEKKARQVRISYMKYLEQLFHVEMNYVFGLKLNGVSPLEDVA